MAQSYQQQGGLAKRKYYALQRSTLERCIIEWEIGNFTVINVPEGGTLNSYQFRSSSYEYTSESVWRLKVNPNISIDGEAFVGLYIERGVSENEYCPVVEADVNFGLLGNDGQIHKIQRFIAKFAQEETKGIDTIVKRKDLLYSENLLPNDTLTVFCEMDVYSIDCNNFFRQVSLTAPPGLKELSDDMKKFGQCMKGTDIKLSISGGFVPCHKAILCSRSPVFTKLVEDAIRHKKDFIKVDDDIAPTIMDLLLGYIYTGDLNLLLTEGFHIKELYRAAFRYRLADLQSFLAPEVYKIKTVVPTSRYQFDWKIENFSRSRDSSKFEFDGPTSNWFVMRPLEWKVTMSGTNVPDSEDRSVDVWLHRISVEPDQDSYQVRFEVCVLDVNGEIVIRDFIEHKFLEDGKCGVNISTRQIFGNSKLYMLNDTLTLRINFAAGSASVENKIEEREICIVFDMDERVCGSEDSDFWSLSEDFKSLLQQQKFHDMKIYSMQNEFKVHECIIAARASAPIPALKEILGKLPSTTVKSFLAFLYTGDGKYLKGHALEIYSLANEFRLDELKRKYSTRLGWILRKSNVLSIAREAHIANDFDLKSKAFAFMVEAGENLLSSRFENENKELAEEIIIYLASKVK